MGSYHPEKVKVSKEQLFTFIDAFTNDIINTKLSDMPGMIPSNIEILKSKNNDIPITSISQLINKFRSLIRYNEDTNEIIDSQQHCNEFLNWLKSKGIQLNPCTIVMATALATNRLYPKTYDLSVFKDI